MNDAELRTRLWAILDLEAADPVDWEQVDQLINDLSERLSQASGYEPPHLVHHYLDDSDIREKDSDYAEAQRADIRRFVETGDREPLESRSVSPWSCLLILGLLVALTVWFLS
jgi:hypothetical protein